MSHFCSQVQIMLLQFLPHSQDCCVIQELSVFGLVSVKYNAVFFWHTTHVQYHQSATHKLIICWVHSISDHQELTNSEEYLFCSCHSQNWLFFISIRWGIYWGYRQHSNHEKYYPAYWTRPEQNLAYRTKTNGIYSNPNEHGVKFVGKTPKNLKK